jgi:hypothetical protein
MLELFLRPAGQRSPKLPVPSEPGTSLTSKVGLSTRYASVAKVDEGDALYQGELAI